MVILGYSSIKEALVLLDPLRLARAIAAAANEHLSDGPIGELAFALARGRGVALSGNTVYIVLSDPLSASRDTLTIVKGELSTSRDGRKSRPEHKVASAFRMECGGSDKVGRQPTGELWLPEVVSPDGHATVGGDLSKPIRSAFGYRVINWYKLSDVPIGGVIYFYRHPFGRRPGHLAVYQRVHETHYGFVGIDNPQQLADVHAVAAQLANGETVDGIQPLEGRLRLIKPGPRPPKS